LPQESEYRIEARSNTYQYNINELNLDETFSIMNLLKFSGGLDVSERRRSQKGSFSFIYQNSSIHIRISSVGDFKDRESMVVRLIYPQTGLDLDDDIFEKIYPISKRKGMMIFSGPMGSGKTTLMYSLCQRLKQDKRIMCIEDPIEIVENDFLQLQVNDNAGMNYEELIKTSLRHRPDVLVIGEIRDQVTAKQAIQAAICGYTVMTTIHGKSKYSVIQRLKQFGISEMEIKNSVNSISYQRLIPMAQDVKLFVDMLDDIAIQKFLDDGLQDDNWKKQLQKLYQDGLINEETLMEYKFG
jgi:Type II secretory pathway, ATPase PulE/Tfp pilus assembly pathway, ATPase PilB